MSFLNFGKDKLTTEHSDAAEIKQAAISDTQLNSLNMSSSTSNPSIPEVPTVVAEQNFVNPFTKTETPQSIETSSNQQVPEVPVPEPEVPKTIETPSSPTSVAPPSQDLNKLNSNLTQSLQSQEALTKVQIKELVDETVEKVIEEKWDSITEKVDRVLRWKEKKEEEINMLKEDIVSIADGFSKLENKLISKISNYDKNILDVNSEIKALEKVFQKVTPTLINNVNELSKIADDLKGVKKEKDKTEKSE